jgi:hypothetical protein
MAKAESATVRATLEAEEAATTKHTFVADRCV